VRPNKLQYFGAFICHLLIININEIFGPVSSCQAGKSHFCCMHLKNCQLQICL